MEYKVNKVNKETWLKSLDEKIDKTIYNFLEREMDEEYFDKILHLIRRNIEKFEGKYEIYPPADKIFNAFTMTKFKDTKVVFLGQDPYIRDNQAMGLSFSVPKETPIPPSLKNIYKELETDIEGFKIPNHGNLESWAKQGVLLLNAALTVLEGQSGSHLKKWEVFTDKVIKYINDNLDGVVFILLGNFAKKKASLIDTNKHAIITGVHPSPLSASSGFFGSKIFSKTNKKLKEYGKEPIDWQI